MSKNENKNNSYVSFSDNIDSLLKHQEETNLFSPDVFFKNKSKNSDSKGFYLNGEDEYYIDYIQDGDSKITKSMTSFHKSNKIDGIENPIIKNMTVSYDCETKDMPALREMLKNEILKIKD